MSLNVWPALPLLVRGGDDSVDDVIAELEHSDRIREIEIYLDRYTTREIEQLWTAMQVPSPELAALYLGHQACHALLSFSSTLGLLTMPVLSTRRLLNVCFSVSVL